MSDRYHPTRVEDDDLLRGRARFVADLFRPGDACLVVVRSRFAHGRLLSIDAEEAATLEGVLAVYTAADLEADLGSMPVIPCKVVDETGLEDWYQPVLARNTVRYVGEPIAVVVATNRYIAEDAADLVFADIDPLPVAMDVTASAPPPLFPRENEPVTYDMSFGDVSAAFEVAPVVIESEVRVGRHTAIPIETRGLHATYSEEHGVTVWGATKTVHWNRDLTAAHLNLPVEQVVLRETAIGGGFGIRGEYYPEDTLVPWAALKLRRTVSWVEDRREHFVAANHARHQIHKVAIAGDRDGKVLALRSEFWIDIGAYVRTSGLRAPNVTATMLPGPYDIPAYAGLAHVVVSNRTPTGTYRAPGRYEATFVCEHLMDLYAERIGMDPQEVRERNLIPRERMPYERGFAKGSLTLSEGDYPAMYETVLREVDAASARSARDGGALVGIGVSPFLESSRLGPWETASVEVDPNRGVVVRSGGSSVGQGLRTMLATVVGEELGIDPLDVVVEMLDTSKMAKGWGSYASRSTATGGSAALVAARALGSKARKIAAHALDADPDTLKPTGGGLGVSGRAMTYEEIASLARSEGGDDLRAEATYETGVVSYEFGTAAAVVRIDRDTGAVHVDRLVIGFDAGNVVNPIVARGQLMGAAVQGVGGALLEELHYDELGNPLTTSFVDYLMPTATEAPELKIITFDGYPSPFNPLGAKGAGEGGITGVGAAIAGAVGDALGAPGIVTSLPVDRELILQVLEGSPP